MATATLDSQLDEIEAAAERWANDPAAYFYERLRVKYLWEGQLEILNLIPRAIREHKPIWVSSGHALGKDFLDGGLPLWWQETHYPAKTIITGPTDRQVKEIVWNELENHYHAADPDIPIGGRLLTGKLEWASDHFVLAFTTADSQQNIGRAQGFHSPNMLILVTEGQAISEGIYDQLEGLTTSSNTLMIVMGNPLVTSGRYARALNDHKNNLIVCMDCEKSPNFLAKREIIPGMVSHEWVEDKRRRWYDKDNNHPLWLSKVKGQLPKTSIENVFSLDMLFKATNNRPAIPRVHKRCIGLDPAAFGDDESAFYCNDSGLCQEMFTTAKQEPTDTAGRAVAMFRRLNAGGIAYDNDGLGQGVGSMLRDLIGVKYVFPYNGSKRFKREESEYYNLRAKMWFHARNEMVKGNVEVPDDDMLKEELAEVKYHYKLSGQIILEPKDDVKDRLGRSPDRADAFVLATWGLQYVIETHRKKNPDYVNRVKKLRNKPKTNLCG